MRSKTFYQILNVDQRATQRQIKSQYYKLSLKFHPDVVKSSDDVSFIQINEAYRVLSDRKLRQIYDVSIAKSGDASYNSISVTSRAPQSNKTIDDFNWEARWKRWIRSSSAHGPRENHQRVFDLGSHLHHTNLRVITLVITAVIVYVTSFKD